MWVSIYNVPKKQVCIFKLFLIKKPNYNDVKENTIPNSGLFIKLSSKTIQIHEISKDIAVSQLRFQGTLSFPSCDRTLIK